MLSAASVLVDEGTLINRGALTLLGTVTVAQSSVFELASGNVSAGSGDVTRIVDEGLLIRTAGPGTITVEARTLDAGVVEVAAGTLDFTSHLLGTGVLKIDGGATLALKIPNAFLATIGGFAVGDVIDLLTLTATGARVNANDQLVVVDGARTVATLQLTENYLGAAFTAASDGHGGTNVELAPGGDAEIPSVYAIAAVRASGAAPPHAFIAAMAGFGATMASHATPGEVWTAHAPLLSTPRVAIA